MVSQLLSPEIMILIILSGICVLKNVDGFLQSTFHGSCHHCRNTQHNEVKSRSPFIQQTYHQSLSSSYCNKFRQHKLYARGPSKVIDEDGLTPDAKEREMEIIDPKDIPELKYDPNNHPIPHQPWRRGMTYGCEDPIDATWRKTAEYLIKTAVQNVGGEIVDITWYLTTLLIHVNTDSLPNVEQYTTGPEIDVKIAKDDGTSKNGPMWVDPNDPKPDDILLDDSTPYVYERDLEFEKDQKEKRYRPEDNSEYKFGTVDKKDPDETDEELGIFPKDHELGDLNDDPGLYMDKETYEDTITMSDEEEVRQQNEPRPVDQKITLIDTAALSTISRAILEVLEEHDEELDILDRHEVVLANYLTPLDPLNYDGINSQYIPGLLQCQKDYDHAVGKDVAVYTSDPWNSNRTLKGKLIKRNTMDVYINKKGRVVTIPQNFIKMVVLRNVEDARDYGSNSKMMSSSIALDDDEDYEDEDYEDEGELEVVGGYEDNENDINEEEEDGDFDGDDDLLEEEIIE